MQLLHSLAAWVIQKNLNFCAVMRQNSNFWILALPISEIRTKVIWKEGSFFEFSRQNICRMIVSNSAKIHAMNIFKIFDFCIRRIKIQIDVIRQSPGWILSDYNPLAQRANGHRRNSRRGNTLSAAYLNIVVCSSILYSTVSQMYSIVALHVWRIFSWPFVCKGLTVISMNGQLAKQEKAIYKITCRLPSQPARL